MKEITGDFTQSGARYALVAGQFNHMITDKLVQGAVGVLQGHGIASADIDCVWVPGAFEIPAVARRLAKTGQYGAIITLGAVIRGATAHFDYVAGECASGIARLNQELEIPVIFGVLTTDTVEQALERAGSKSGNKGGDAALAALQMVSLLKQI